MKSFLADLERESKMGRSAEVFDLLRARGQNINRGTPYGTRGTRASPVSKLPHGPINITQKKTDLILQFSSKTLRAPQELKTAKGGWFFLGTGGSPHELTRKTAKVE